MKRYLAVFCTVVLAVVCIATDANAQAAAAKAHVDAAKAAVAAKVNDPKVAPFHNFQALFEQMCAEPKLPDTVRQETDRWKPVPRKDWFTWPANLFDNLYFIGTKQTGIYAVNTSDGIFMIDANFEYDAKELTLELLNFGLDPNNIKYIIITHGHDDRYYGTKSLQEAYPKAHVVMSAADWDLVAKDNGPAQFKPKKDMVATDGQKFTLGDVTITTYITPGHTPGTLSLIIEPLWNKKSVASDNIRHVAAIWGGTDINLGRQGVQYWKTGTEMMNQYIASVNRFADIAQKAGVDVILTQTPRHANTAEKIRAWRLMNPDESGGGNPDGVLGQALKLEGAPHPFANKDAVARYFKVLSECYQANLAWRMGS
jgi:metallo-beta-lactamase class B